MGGSGEKRTLPLVAKYADHWNYPTKYNDSGDGLRRARAILDDECARIGRDPKEIRISTSLRSPEGPAAFARKVEEFGDAGTDVVIVVPSSHDVGELETLMSAVEHLAT